MGWASGGEIAHDMIKGLKRRKMAPKDREKVYACLIPSLFNGDWDTQGEMIGLDPAFDKVLKKLDPDSFEGDE